MNANINTAAINVDLNPGMWLSDERVQTLGDAALPYLNLVMYAAQLNATTGSVHVDGEFSRADALRRVRHITDDVLNILLDAGLLEQLDPDTFLVWLWQSTSHDRLQSAADQRRGKTDASAKKLKATKDAQQEHEDTAARTRELSAARQRKWRESQKPAAVVPPPPDAPEPDDVMEPDDVNVTAEDRDYVNMLHRQKQELWQSAYDNADMTVIMPKGTATNGDATFSMSEEQRRQLIEYEAARLGHRLNAKKTGVERV